MNEPTQNIDKFLGIRNREQPRRMAVGALVKADNVDIDDMGGVVIRNGYSLSLSLTSMTASFCTQDERRSFVVDDGDLVLIKADLSKSTLAQNIPNKYIYWVEVVDFVLMSTGHLISKDNVVTSWKIPTPAQPKVAVVGGNLRAGRYKVSVVYVDAVGREGGSSDIFMAEVGDDSGLNVTPVFNGYTVKVYVSDTNSDIMYFYSKIISGSASIASTLNLVYPLDKAQLKTYPAPDTDSIAYFEGKLYVSQYDNGQSVVWYSKPFWWNLFDLQNDFLIIPGRITGLIGAKEGLLIATDDEIYVFNESLVRLADYGTPEGEPFTTDDKGNVFIHSNQGLCIAFPFQNLTEHKVSLPSGSSCSVQCIEQNGTNKIVVLTDGLGVEDNKYN